MAGVIAAAVADAGYGYGYGRRGSSYGSGYGYAPRRYHKRASEADSDAALIAAALPALPTAFSPFPLYAAAYSGAIGFPAATAPLAAIHAPVTYAAAPAIHIAAAAPAITYTSGPVWATPAVKTTVEAVGAPAAIEVAAPKPIEVPTLKAIDIPEIERETPVATINAFAAPSPATFAAHNLYFADPIFAPFPYASIPAVTLDPRVIAAAAPVAVEPEVPEVAVEDVVHVEKRSAEPGLGGLLGKSGGSSYPGHGSSSSSMSGKLGGLFNKSGGSGSSGGKSAGGLGGIFGKFGGLFNKSGGSSSSRGSSSSGHGSSGSSMSGKFGGLFSKLG